MPAWLDRLEQYEAAGFAETAGAGNNPTIVAWMQGPGQAPWVSEDATPWCGGAIAGILAEVGLSHVIPDVPVTARNWLNCGVALEEPRVGAIVVFPRPPNPKSGHVTCIKDFDAKWLYCVGGNQSDRITTAKYPRTGPLAPLGYRWPVPIKTPKELKAESRIAAAAARQKRDQAVAGGAGASIPATPAPAAPAPPAAPPEAIPAPLEPHWKESVENILGDFTWFKTAAGGVIDFGAFVGTRWWYVAGGIAAYFLARSFWDSHRISLWRTSDHNEGRSR